MSFLARKHCLSLPLALYCRMLPLLLEAAPAANPARLLPARLPCRRGSEVEVRPPRLGLARVSVLRGQGPAKGSACIDDYIRSAEQVHDYLTKFR